MNNLFLEKAVSLIEELDRCQQGGIDAASELFVECLLQGGIIQAFGSGHSYAAAIEMVERAGGLFASKVIRDPALGIYESVEGVGSILMRKVEIRPEDVVVIISHSGRNPLGIEVAMAAKERGAKLLAITSVEASRKLTSRHSSGKLLYELADAILDTMVGDGDAAIHLDALPENICPISSVAAACLIQATMLRTTEKLISRGYQPDIRVSANLDGGTEHNLALQERYAHRIYRI